MTSPVLSVCVCTWNGSERIEDTLWSLVCQTAAPGSYELRVVDNGSADEPQLRALVERVAARFEALSLHVEPELGLARARNRGVAESRGEYVLFLDDDAVASPRLVEHLLAAISEHCPDVLGGNVLPLFEEAPPPEMDSRWWPSWSLKHFGSRGRWLDDGEYFLGTNVAAARSLLLEHPFDARLGRRGAALTGAEEWYLGDARFRRRFVPGAVVFHKVPAERQGVAYLAQRCREGPRGAAGAGGKLAALAGLVVHELALTLRRLRLAAAVRLAGRRKPGEAQEVPDRGDGAHLARDR